MKNDIPIIFWHSDPAGPDETILLAGDRFEEGASVEAAPLPADDAGEPGAEPAAPPDTEWRPLQVLQRSGQSLKAVIPAEWPEGVYACRVRRGDGAVSETIYANAPDLWWTQGDEGVSRASAGGWLRVFGKCLASSAGKSSAALLGPGDARPVFLPLDTENNYCICCRVPAELAPGDYSVWAHNGAGGAAMWRRAGAVSIIPAPADNGVTLNVLDYGADPSGREDCTHPIVWGLARLAALGGGTLYFPRGRYRVDSRHRSGMDTDTPLRIPPGVTLRGEGEGLTSLWWPDRENPLPSLIEGFGRFTVERLGIYTQGRHRNVVSCESGNVRIRHVRIRVNCYYMTGEGGAPHHRRGVSEPPSKMGSAFELWGENNQVTDCDIYFSNVAFFLKNVRGALIARNTVHAANFLYNCPREGVIIEDNHYCGNSLSAGGSAGAALHFGALSARHVYFARNTIEHVYGGDHEAFTLDGHGTAYLGRVLSSEGTRVTLERPPHTGRSHKDELVDLCSAAVFVLSGTGRGQYRFVRSVSGSEIETDRPWTVNPDSASLVSIGAFNGRHLIIGNTFRDTGTMTQLYPPNFECVVAGNIGVHCSNINSVSKLGVNLDSSAIRAEPSWFNQFLDNHIAMGNGWGGGETEMDRWIGGESTLVIRGAQVATVTDEHGANQDRPLTAEDLCCVLTPGTKRDTPALSLCQIVRRHRIDNNSSIRVRGAVDDVVIEKCVTRDAERGVRVGCEVNRPTPPDIGQLCFEPDDDAPAGRAEWLSPRLILIRKNVFSNVSRPYSGTALKNAVVPES